MGEQDPDEDEKLFLEAMRGVRPLTAGNTRLPTPPARVSPVRRNRRAPVGDPAGMAPLAASPTPVAQVERGEVLEYRAAGVQQNVVRNLRRGQYPVEGSLDLHGLTALRATEVLRAFLDEARAAEARCVRIVHGKGLGSGNRGPVLKTLTNTWLRDQPAVLAFVSAPRADGGTGATLVLLSRRRRAD
jgi:DNA-nicking Smr family endonuclease